MKQSTLRRRFNKALQEKFVNGTDRYKSSDYAVIAVNKYIGTGIRTISTENGDLNHAVQIIRLLNSMGLKYTIDGNMITIKQSVIFTDVKNDSHVELI